MKKPLLALAIAASITLPNSARATGIPTVDVAAILQSIIEWTTQIEELNEAISQVQELENQLAQAEEAYAAVNGLRDVGNLLNSDLYNEARNYLPTNWRETLEVGGDISNGRYSSLKDYMDAIRAASRKYEANELGGTDSAAYQGWAEQNVLAADGIGVNRKVEQVVEQRYGEFVQYKQELPAMADAKSVQDLQATVAIEQLMLQNELIGLLARQQRMADEAAVLASKSDEEILAASNRTFDSRAQVERLLRDEGIQ